MKKFIVTFLMLMLTFVSVVLAQTTEDNFVQLRSEVSALKSKQANLESIISQKDKDIAKLKSQIQTSDQKFDSLKSELSSLRDSLLLSNQNIKNEICKTNLAVNEKEVQISSVIENKTIIGIVLLALMSLIGAIISFVLGKKVSKTDSLIENVKDVQSHLQNAQKKLEEESVKLDNSLVELIEKKIEIPESVPLIDHSLILKVADEITRIELNLSRMDSTMKGYKQLSKGIERIKDNFMAKGYEITTLLGKPYDEGMRINADFIVDESLDPGSRIITSITKPQVIYNGEMIQKAIVIVSQNI